jgi:hypothetical protein
MYRSGLVLLLLLGIGCSPAQQKGLGVGFAVAGGVATGTGLIMSDPCGKFVGRYDHDCHDDRDMNERRQGAVVLTTGLIMVLTGAALYVAGSNPRRQPNAAPAPAQGVGAGAAAAPGSAAGAAPALASSTSLPSSALGSPDSPM